MKNSLKRKAFTLVELLDGSWRNFDPAGDSTFNTRLASQSRIPSFECPSDDTDPVRVFTLNFHNDVFNPDLRDADEFGLDYGLTNYSPIAGVLGSVTSATRAGKFETQRYRGHRGKISLCSMCLYVLSSL